MKAPPRYPFWPLSVAGPNRIAGLTFESKELKNLPAFRDALAARGKDYELIRRTDAPGLLLDLSLASKSRLLRQVVEDWGVVFSLWKTADAYLEAEGEKRKHLRTLLKQLFFWAGFSRSRNVWPAHLTARHILLKREDEMGSAERRAVRAEAFAVRLVIALEKIARELRIYSRVAHSALRPSIRAIVKECDACLDEAEYLERAPSRVRSRFRTRKPGLEEAHKADGVTIKLAATMERALAVLKEAISRFRPVDAFRARHVIRESETPALRNSSRTATGPPLYSRWRHGLRQHPLPEPFVGWLLADSARSGHRRSKARQGSKAVRCTAGSRVICSQL